jgi:hypothetical protein
VEKGLLRQKYTQCYTARKDMAFLALALLLSVDLRTTFKINELSDNMEATSALWTFITKHFEAGDGIIHHDRHACRDIRTRCSWTA